MRGGIYGRLTSVPVFLHHRSQLFFSQPGMGVEGVLWVQDKFRDRTGCQICMLYYIVLTPEGAMFLEQHIFRRQVYVYIGKSMET